MPRKAVLVLAMVDIIVVSITHSTVLWCPSLCWPWLTLLWSIAHTVQYCGALPCACHGWHYCGQYHTQYSIVVPFLVLAMVDIIVVSSTHSTALWCPSLCWPWSTLLWSVSHTVHCYGALPCAGHGQHYCDQYHTRYNIVVPFLVLAMVDIIVVSSTHSTALWCPSLCWPWSTLLWSVSHTVHCYGALPCAGHGQHYCDQYHTRYNIVVPFLVLAMIDIIVVSSTHDALSCCAPNGRHHWDQ